MSHFSKLPRANTPLARVIGSKQQLPCDIQASNGYSTAPGRYRIKIDSGENSRGPNLSFCHTGSNAEEDVGSQFSFDASTGNARLEHMQVQCRLREALVANGTHPPSGFRLG